MRYPDLRQDKDEGGRSQWSYADGKKRIKLYAGKITNNIVQGTARCVMTDGMLRVAKKYPLVGTVHDELIAVIPEGDEDYAKTWVLAQMTMEPPYLPGIPLDAGVGVHKRYGMTKD
jgi:DNA polymerase